MSAQASANPRGVNARERGDFDTRFSVHVRREADDMLLPGAVVTLTSRTGSTVLTFDGEEFQGTASGYDEVYVLDIDAGVDGNLLGVRVQGPDIHTFASPVTGATVGTGEVVVEWARDDRANSAHVWAHGFDGIEVEDTGTFTIPAGRLTIGDNVGIHIERTNSVEANGAHPGSELRVQVENRVNVIVQ